MRNASAALKSAAASTVTTLGWLCRITTIDGANVYLNNFGKNVTVGGNVYLGNPGFDIGNIRVTDGRDPPSVELILPIDDTTPILFDAAARRKLDQARIRLYIIDHSSLENVEIGFQWYVGAVDALDSRRATLDVRAAERAQRELMLKSFKPGCQWDLGETGCGVDVAGSWQDSVTVATYTDAFTFTISGARGAAVDDFFANGAIKFTSGENEGFSYAVRRWVQSSSTVKLWEPLRAPVAASDTALIHAGCDKSVGANGCERFSNIARRFAFEDLPTGDLTFNVKQPAPAQESSGDNDSYVRWAQG
ncbi:Gene Transfer Agent FAD/FMN-containing dehydrogenase [Sinorhizobium sojae CCBAU 05684]|uniref:Gene Transfer Agent FAD/FMN-containing dehydrogenase n=1 Tax=Sinorhizobium sojae CCBAU 05684 TaxID=716928 RepID=A0A249PA36_9HYPH|nr:DUF2163 domain-containing protein [Sinorhizobium sojae]ASY62534.1 Gene Transfer Agent FAD/FMN-containing dehydrogenase [Sinorhizobium sojae CCBAU 05684]